MVKRKNGVVPIINVATIIMFMALICYRQAPAVPATPNQPSQTVLNIEEEEIVEAENPMKSAIKVALNEAIGFSDVNLSKAVEVVYEAIDKGYEPNVAIDELTDTVLYITQVQPAFNRDREGGLERAIDIGTLIFKYSLRNELPRLVVASIGMRESSYRVAVEDGTIRGKRNEAGLFQIMPNGRAVAISEKCNLLDRECNIKVATNYLAKIKDICVNKLKGRCTTDTWVAWYGRRKSLMPKEARFAPEVKAARRWLCSVRPLDCNLTWNFEY